MELLAPAGSAEKLRFAYLYGADAAYMGLQGFSLRAHADNAINDDMEQLSTIKGSKKLYAAANMVCNNADLDRLKQTLSTLEHNPFDAFIVSDLGVYATIKQHFPKAEFHLSTQASCLNAESAKIYRDLGFRRIIPAREASLADIADIKQKVPELEIEVFVHGAMCMAYSGRCMLSTEMTGRSANRGDCAHSCRWDYRVLEESQRQGEYLPVLTQDGFTAIFSSKDLNMIHHLREIKNSGADSLKIEGRMKSLYYVAIVTQAYRAGLSALDGSMSQAEAETYFMNLESVSHREFDTGFFFDRSTMNTASNGSYRSTHRFLGTIVEHCDDGRYRIELLNTLNAVDTLEIVCPGQLPFQVKSFTLESPRGLKLDRAVHQKEQYLRCAEQLPAGSILRVAEKDPDRLKGSGRIKTPVQDS